MPRRDTLPSLVVAPHRLADPGPAGGFTLRESVMLPPAPEPIADRHDDSDSNHHQQSQQIDSTNAIELGDSVSTVPGSKDPATKLLADCAAAIRAKLIEQARKDDFELEDSSPRQQREFARFWKVKSRGFSPSQSKVSQMLHPKETDPIDTGLKVLLMLRDYLQMPLDELLGLSPTKPSSAMGLTEDEADRIADKVAEKLSGPTYGSGTRRKRTR